MTEPLTQEQLETLQHQLQQMEKDLRNALEDSADSAKPVQLDQQLMGRVSRIDAIQQQSMANASRANQELLLRKVLLALRLVEEGEYGYCRQCDEPIPFGRLQIKPEATLCINCQSAAEQ